MKRKASKIAKKSDEEKRIIIPDPLKACFDKVYKRLQTRQPGIPEIKWCDNNSHSTFEFLYEDQWEYATWSLLGGLPNGTTATSRIGSNIQNQFILFQFNIQQVSTLESAGPPAAITPVAYGNNISSSLKWHVAVVIDRQPKEVTATYGEIFAIGDGFKTVMRNMSNIDRFDVIYEQFIATNNIWAPTKIIHADIPLHYLKTTYPTGGDTPNWPVTNDVLLAFGTTSLFNEETDFTLPTNTPLAKAYVSSGSRIYFTDG